MLKMFEDDYRIYHLRDAKYFGPKFWDFLYLTVLGFPITLTQEQQSAFKALLQNFHIYLPCSSCREHFKKETKNLNIETRDQAFNEIIRRRLGKTEIYPEDTIAHFYNEFSNSYTYITMAIIIILILFHKCAP
jgi:hypothetical protein